MRNFLFIALALSALSSLGHFYLAKRSYELKTGEASASKICNIGENINCDSALLSPYAEVLGVSLSNFGLSFNFALFLILLFFFLFKADSYWKNISFYLASGIALTSVVMAGISLLNKLYCPVCWSLYLFSFIVFLILFFAFKSDLDWPFHFLKENGTNKNSYIIGGCILLASLFFHASFVTAFDIKSQDEMQEIVFLEWQSEPAIPIPKSHILQKGPQNSQIILVEFVDFLCSFCKKVQPALKAFLNLFNDVNFQFYVYPLDGTCNPSMDIKGSGLSCELSKALICAEKQNKGWPAHDFFFEKQSEFQESQGNKEKIKVLLGNMQAQIGIDSQEFERCMKDNSTLAKLKESISAGQAVKVQGTPNFFINGKKVRNHSLKLLIFRQIYKYLKEEI